MSIKLNITRSVILEHALALVKESGIEKLNARSLANHIGYSTQPIFSVYKNMGEIWDEVAKEAEGIYFSFVEEVKKSGKYPESIDSYVAHAKFAVEEKALFKLLFIERGDKLTEMLYSSCGNKSAFAAAHGLALIHLTTNTEWSESEVSVITAE